MSLVTAERKVLWWNTASLSQANLDLKVPACQTEAGSFSVPAYRTGGIGIDFSDWFSTVRTFFLSFDAPINVPVWTWTNEGAVVTLKFFQPLITLSGQSVTSALQELPDVTSLSGVCFYYQAEGH